MGHTPFQRDSSLRTSLEEFRIVSVFRMLEAGVFSLLSKSFVHASNQASRLRLLAYGSSSDNSALLVSLVKDDNTICRRRIACREFHSNGGQIMRSSALVPQRAFIISLVKMTLQCIAGADPFTLEVRPIIVDSSKDLLLFRSTSETLEELSASFFGFGAISEPSRFTKLGPLINVRHSSGDPMLLSVSEALTIASESIVVFLPLLIKIYLSMIVSAFYGLPFPCSVRIGIRGVVFDCSICMHWNKRKIPSELNFILFMRLSLSMQLRACAIVIG
jgi:hypothetical protein